MKPIHTNYQSTASIASQPDSRSAAEVSLPPHFHVILLALVSLITIGSHYGKHSLSSLGPEMMATLEVKRAKFGLLFSSQELPGIVLPIVGGLALTYVPHGPAAVFLSSSIFVSTAFCALAVASKSYGALLFGRFLFGLCDGALTTLQAALIAHWFKGKIGSSFGVALLVSRLSSFAGLSLPAFISQKHGLIASMWFSVAVCIPPVIATILYAIFAARYASYHPMGEVVSLHPVDEALGDSLSSRRETGPRDFVALMRSFPLPFWLICYIWVAVAGSVFSFLHFASDAFSAQLGLSATRSGLLSGSLVLIAGLSSPAIGVIQDRIGQRPGIIGISCGLICLGILTCSAGVGSALLPFLSEKYVVYTGVTLVAAGFAAAPVTLMSSLALSVDDFVTAAALGLYKATENAGLAVIHVGTGILRDESGSYAYSFAFLAMLAGSGVLAAAWLGTIAPVLRCRADEITDS